jgi:hypothetical protein
VVVLITCDGDFAGTVKLAVTQGHHVLVFLRTSNCSTRLAKAASEVFSFDELCREARLASTPPSPRPPLKRKYEEITGYHQSSPQTRFDRNFIYLACVIDQIEREGWCSNNLGRRPATQLGDMENGL